MNHVIKDDRLVGTTGRCCSVSWSAVIAGALVAFSLSALFNLLNAGLGLVAFPQTFRGLTSLTIGGYIWLIICGIIAMFIAGWVAGKIIKHFSNSCYGMLHGFLAWSLSLLLSLIIAAHFMNIGAEAMDRTNVDNRINASTLLDRNVARTEQAADIAGTTTLGIFFIFLIGAAAATLGGYVGAKNDELPTDTRTHTTKY